MARLVTQYSVLIASPGDLKVSRQTAHDTVIKWNELQGAQRQVVLTPIMWETHATPEMGGRAQEILNRQIVDDSDIVIGMFWTRLGLPTGAANSGTVEELERLIKAGRRASIYFCTTKLDPYKLDTGQFQCVQQYRAECEQRGLLSEFATDEELREQLLRHLSHHVDELQAKAGDNAVGSAAPDEADRTQETARQNSAPALESNTKGGAVDQDWYKLFETGKYEEALAALAAAASRGDLKSLTLEETRAFGQYVAFDDGGVYKAFLDLKESANASPVNMYAKFWYAIALKRQELNDESLTEMRYVTEHAQGKLLRYSLNWLADELFDAGRASEAMTLWRNALETEANPHVRGLYISRIAQTFSSNAIVKDMVRAHELHEYALELAPADLKRRLKVAYEYGVEQKIASIGLQHYREILTRDPDNGTALVNAGWIADRLSMPITSIEYYEAGAKQRESLAATNMGWKLLEGGFAKDAEKMVTAARATEGGAADADKLAVAIRDKRDDENSRWQTTAEKVEKVRSWRVRFSKAFTSTAISPDSITGVYVGNLGSIQVIADASATVTGSLTLPNGNTATLSGRIEGKALLFDWVTQSVKPTGNSLLNTLKLAVKPVSGYGRFTVSGSTLQGYTAEGQEPLDPLEVDSMVEWDLKRTH